MALSESDLAHIVLNHLALPGKAGSIPIAESSWDPAHTRDIASRAGKVAGRPVGVDLAIRDAKTGIYHVFLAATRLESQDEASAAVRAIQSLNGADLGLRLYLMLPVDAAESLTESQAGVVAALASIAGPEWLLLDWPDKVRKIRSYHLRMLMSALSRSPEQERGAAAETGLPWHAAPDEEEEEAPVEAKLPRSWRDLLKRPIFWILILGMLLQLLRFFR